MKIHNLLSCLIIIILLVPNTGCKKDYTDPIPIRPNTFNTAPTANAGEDLFVWSPLNEGELHGSYLDGQQNVNEVSWSKISGPNSYVLENKNSLHTKISGLETGDYQFELMVIDKLNLYDKDTMVVSVGEMPVDPNEYIFKDQVWIFPWYNNVEIKNFVSNIPPGTPFNIFIQRDNDPDWKEVPPETASWPGIGFYDYFIVTANLNGMYNDRSLYITYYGFDVDDTPNVKVVY